MLRANVNISRKPSKDFNSTGFGVSLDAEIQANLDDPEAVIERVRELYDLAEEALQRQIEAHQSDSAIASWDADPPPRKKAQPEGRPAPEANGKAPRGGHRDEEPPDGEPATNKQIQYLLTLAKRHKLQMPGLEARIGEVIGRRWVPYDLTKAEAGSVIDALSPEPAANGRARA